MLKQSELNFRRGLEIQLFTGVSDLLFTNLFKIHDYEGIFLSIENQTDFPFTNSKNLFFLDYGKQYILGLTKTVTKSLPSPYGDCVNPKTYNSHFQADFNHKKLNYTKSNCVIFCQQRNIQKSCGCHLISMASIATSQPCLGNEDLSCSYRALNAFNANDCCSDVCPSECEIASYQFSSSSLVTLILTKLELPYQLIKFYIKDISYPSYQMEGTPNGGRTLSTCKHFAR